MRRGRLDWNKKVTNFNENWEFLSRYVKVKTMSLMKREPNLVGWSVDLWLTLFNTKKPYAISSKGLHRARLSWQASGTTLVIEIWNQSFKNVDGHCERDIPFKSDPLELQDNKNMAEKQLQSLGRRTAQEISSRNHRLSAEGHAEAGPEDEIDGVSGKPWYLPHHNVVNPIKPEKFSFLFYCAARYAGTSLSMRVLQRLDLANNLLGVLMRFREGKLQS